MSEKDIILKTSQPITIKRIKEDLIRLGINPGDTILVHSSLSNIGWVCGGAQAVISSLLEVIGDLGTLIMPAHSGEWSNPEDWENPPVPKEWIPIIQENMPAFHPDLTPTRGMGRIAELFRTFSNTLRSNHPQVSFSAKGRLAKEIVQEHLLTPQFGMTSSPLGKMYNIETKILLLGVGYDSCTSFHLAETQVKDMPKERMGTAMLENGTRVWKWFEDYEYDADDFEKLGKAFEDKYFVQKGTVGNAQCKLFDMREGVDFAKLWLEKNRFSK